MKELRLNRKALILPLAILITGTGCSRHKTEQTTETPVPVTVQAAHLIEEGEWIAASGTVASPNEPSNASFLVSGRIIRALPREGDPVKKGQLLATLEAKDYSFGVDAAHAQTAAAQVSLVRAEDEYRRMKALYDLKSLAPNDFEKFKAAFEAAQKQVEQAKASENIARKRVTDAVLTAPISGYVSKRMVEPGNIVSAGTPVFQIVTLDPVEISVGIPETDISQLHIGQKAKVHLTAQPDEQFEGAVKQINVVADPGTRTYSVRISVPNPQHKIRLGMIAEAQIQSPKRIQAVVIPGSAVTHDAQGANIVYLYYPEQKRVFAKRVEIGGVTGNEIQIKSGIVANDPVVTGGQQFLRDGMSVVPTQTAKANTGEK